MRTRLPRLRRACPVAVIPSLLALLFAACGGSSTTPSGTVDGGDRAYRLGFSALGPVPTLEAALQTLETWTPRGDVAIMHMDVPWARLLAGEDPKVHVTEQIAGLADYYRDRGMPIVFMADPTDGLAREREAAALRERGRSIAEQDIQALYADWVVEVARQIEPAYLGLAAETNLIREVAPEATYRGLVQMTNAAAARLRALGQTPHLFVSAQVETAWGRLAGNGSYRGVEQDIEDFPFVDVLGLSSYPYLGGFEDPENVPLDYYSRLREEAELDVMVVEGGWPSVSTQLYGSSEREQADYLRRHSSLLQRAEALAVLQLTFTDLDVDAWGAPDRLNPFTRLGLVETTFEPKAALSVWDSLYTLPLRREGF